ncbi:archaetidylserine decarboxylase [Ramlibacter solisilvae]|uniref:Phosphatidylserine decarboxylase proenzyme n=1 Tax=Ramlibacter tataouinensis TaxID=94132 RepID=A0A127JSE5_9BURK|nr:archaetidylserine decarboxylase [Ramlibacter tataouinensis]AMO22918.1 phosphatidylserine decarboxylase [Ramlibacter tataouinensis]
MSTRLAVAPQYLLPKRLLTQVMGLLARWHGGAITRWAIRKFIARYKVNMAEAADPRVESYATFNEFFTRPLRPGTRTIADAPFVCPVDAAISQFGPIEHDQIFQAKGHSYSTRALVGGDAQLAQQFDHGHFATLYLAPKDYHRIHMPCDGVLKRMIYVPGDLFSVNPLTARHVPGLFARNERVVCVFDTEYGPFVNVLVGATIVGSMATVWHGVVNPPRTGHVREWRYDGKDIRLAKGDEMGRFLLGSTVVMLFPQNVVTFNADWAPTHPVKLGEAMATFAGAESVI